MGAGVREESRWTEVLVEEDMGGKGDGKGGYVGGKWREEVGGLLG